MLAYCVYSVLSPELQKRRMDAARKKRFRMYAVKVIGQAAVDPVQWLLPQLLATV